jgi:hypothetical protein
VTDQFQVLWAILTGVLCVLVVVALAFTGPLALAGGLIVLALSVGCRWLITRYLARADR